MSEGALIVSRWLQFAAATILCGAPAFALYGLSSAAKHRHAAWLKRLLAIAASIGLAAALAMLLAQSAEMGGDPALAFDGGTVWAVVTGTYFGTVWLVRLVLLALALALTLILPMRRDGLAALTLVGTLVAASLAWMGHGGEGEGVTGGLHRVADVFHLAAAAAWIGALVVLVRLLTALARHEDDALRGLQRFSGVGPLVVATLIVTGFVNAWALAGARPILEAIATPYAFVLYAKLAFFVAMLILASLNRFQFIPKLEAVGANAPVRDAAIATLRRSVIAETVLAALVILIVAALGVLEPPSAS